MSVLIEATSVVLKRKSIEERFPGGMKAFQSSAPNRTLCADDHLVRLGFMAPSDVKDFIGHLEACGLVHLKDGHPVDFAVVDQVNKLATECDWIGLETISVENGSVLTAFSKECGSVSNPFSVPKGWQFANSLSDKLIFIPIGEIQERFEKVEVKSGVITYRDRSTGETVYLGSQNQSESDAEFDSIRSVVERALALETLRNQPKTLGEVGADQGIQKELVEELLPRIKNLSLQSKYHTWFVHFAWGLVLRVSKKPEDAIEQFRISLSHSPDFTLCLLELTRCLGELNRHDEAAGYAKSAVKHEPDNPAALGNLAMVSIALRDEETARTAIRKALSLAPEDKTNLRISSEFRRVFGHSYKSDKIGSTASERPRRAGCLGILACGIVLMGLSLRLFFA